MGKVQSKAAQHLLGGRVAEMQRYRFYAEEEYDFAEAVLDLVDVRKRPDLDGFNEISLGLVADFKQGKSTLCNMLLDFDNARITLVEKDIAAKLTLSVSGVGKRLGAFEWREGYNLHGIQAGRNYILGKIEKIQREVSITAAEDAKKAFEQSIGVSLDDMIQRESRSSIYHRLRRRLAKRKTRVTEHPYKTEEKDLHMIIGVRKEQGEDIIKPKKFTCHFSKMVVETKAYPVFRERLKSYEI